MSSKSATAPISLLDELQTTLAHGTVARRVETLRRVTDKLVHQPTIRAKELGDRSASSYAAALAELFALDPEAVDAVTRPEGLT